MNHRVLRRLILVSGARLLFALLPNLDLDLANFFLDLVEVSIVFDFLKRLQKVMISKLGAVDGLQVILETRAENRRWDPFVKEIVL